MASEQTSALTKVAATCLPAQHKLLTSCIAVLTGCPRTDPVWSAIFQDKGRKFSKMVCTSLGHLRTSLATCVECWDILVKTPRISQTVGVAGLQTSRMYLNLGKMFIWIRPCLRTKFVSHWLEPNLSLSLSLSLLLWFTVLLIASFSLDEPGPILGPEVPGEFFIWWTETFSVCAPYLGGGSFAAH